MELLTKKIIDAVTLSMSNHVTPCRRVSDVISVDVVFVFEQSKLSSAPLELVLDLLLHEVKAHGEKRETEGEPESADDQLLAGRPFFHARPRHDVAEPDRRQRHETEVRPGQVVPVLPDRKQHRPGEDVAGDYDETDRYRNRHFDLQTTKHQYLTSQSTAVRHPADLIKRKQFLFS